MHNNDEKIWGEAFLSCSIHIRDSIESAAEKTSDKNIANNLAVSLLMSLTSFMIVNMCEEDFEDEVFIELKRNVKRIRETEKLVKTSLDQGQKIN